MKRGTHSLLFTLLCWKTRVFFFRCYIICNRSKEEVGGRARLFALVVLPLFLPHIAFSYFLFVEHSSFCATTIQSCSFHSISNKCLRLSTRLGSTADGLPRPTTRSSATIPARGYRPTIGTTIQSSNGASWCQSTAELLSNTSRVPLRLSTSPTRGRNAIPLRPNALSTRTGNE